MADIMTDKFWGDRGLLPREDPQISESAELFSFPLDYPARLEALRASIQFAQDAEPVSARDVVDAAKTFLGFLTNKEDLHE